MLVAFKCSIKFGDITIEPEEELDELLELEEDELEEEDEDDEEELDELPDDELLLDDDELLPDDDELLEEDPTQTGILHWNVELFKQHGTLAPVHIKVSLIVQSGV